MLAGEDVGDGGLADIAALAAAVAVHDVLEGGQFQDPDGVEEFLAGEPDVFAQRRGDLDAGLGEFAVEELLEHRDA
ncbi:hypothetical protein AB0305_16100 [Arthrobacter sp. NPDC080086]|uniref:hypothetical protein n=1 Tax=Arthrobacter sp. NPDC080086 TaxID=3155917 RepID=UPI00344FC4D4